MEKKNQNSLINMVFLITVLLCAALLIGEVTTNILEELSPGGSTQDFVVVGNSPVFDGEPKPEPTSTPQPKATQSAPDPFDPNIDTSE
ncbi:MAG: hypothetical protein NC238_00875 [Dehalobacter sp.]|nr:hypothetical protein [Dehalobacter sp.]